MNDKSRMTLIGETVALVVAFAVFGVFAPWWAVVIPALAYGFLREKSSWHVRRVALAAGISWIVPALYYDIKSEFRVSKRVGGVMMFPSPILVYVFILVLVGVLAVLGSLTGSSLREAFRRTGSGPRLGAKPKD